MNKRIGIYSGTFDPITLGHLDIVARSAKLFDTFIIAVAIAHHKKTMFTLDERIALVKESIKTENLQPEGCEILVSQFDGLIVDLCKSKGTNVSIVRGVRNASDLDYEAQMAAMNQKMLPSVETIFLLPTPNVQCISSTLVREISKLGGDVTQMVSANVLAALKAS